RRPVRPREGDRAAPDRSAPRPLPREGRARRAHDGRRSGQGHRGVYRGHGLRTGTADCAGETALSARGPRLMVDQLVVLIASPLEPEHVDRIRAVDPCIEVLWEPELLPTPRYVSDHTGPGTPRAAAEEARFLDLLARAEV